jgi:hypothetical protein
MVSALLLEVRLNAIHDHRRFFGCIQGQFQPEKYYVFPDSNGENVFQEFQAFSLDCGEKEWEEYEKCELEVPSFLSEYTPKEVEWGVALRRIQQIKRMLRRGSILNK